MKTYKELDVWQKAVDLAVEIYLEQSQIVGLETATTSIGRMLNGLIQALRARGVSQTPEPRPLTP